MSKLVWLLVLAVLSCRFLTGKWPWQLLAKPNEKQKELARARALLDVSAYASVQEIRDAHRRRITAFHPDRGGTNAQVHEVNAARDLLVNTLSSES